MMFSENRLPLFRILLEVHRYLALPHVGRFHPPPLPLIVPLRAVHGGLLGEMMTMSRMLALAGALAAFITAGSLAPAAAQQPSTPPYGPPITLDDAKRAMSAAELEAAKNSWQVAITILDSGGNLVMFHKVDNTQLASIPASEGKARTALTFKRPSKALDDAIAAGGAGLRLLAVKDITPLEGGLPILVDGKIIGAIGVSGALSSQDAQVAKAGADALAK
jgi:glc operon protein GlcG